MNFKLCKIKAVLLCAAVLTIAGTVTVFAGNASSGSVAANYILGDADGDGNVTINDVTCIQTSIAELPLSGGISQLSADVDGNGEIEISDATLIQQWLAEMTTPYSIGENPSEEPSQIPTDEEGWGTEIFCP